MANGKKGVREDLSDAEQRFKDGRIGYRGSDGKDLSDAEQRFVDKIQTKADMGKAPTSQEKKQFKNITGYLPQQQPTPTRQPNRGQTKSDEIRQKRMRLGETPMEEIRRTSQRIRHGGPVKKYAKGGGVRKARYK